MIPEHIAQSLEPDALAHLQARFAAQLPPVYSVPVAAARKGVEAAQALPPGAAPAADVREIEAACGPSGMLRLRLLKPEGASGKLPVLVYFHGGGWVLGSPDSHDRLARDLMTASGAAVLMVRYSRAPEARYPVAVEEGYAALRWLAENAPALGLDPARMAVGGDSAGANVATAACMLSKQRGGPAIAHQTLLYPVTDATCSQPSYEQFATGLNLTRQDMLWYWEQYAPDAAQRALPTSSVLQAPAETLAGLPPALVITAEFDVLRDEGELYARRLANAGVPVCAVRMLGTVHGFAANNALARSQATLAALGMAGDALRRAFCPAVAPAL
ncbi:alpha/beta hydrolase [Fundidesulfovibrio agrisoli]|uniref:alpha/beta hydrolase n=1 Tax=Fundidesulfovibrio agrisoli TaxID=2922717 RepID=UPI001FAD08BC|nr:alpha/beta hydrolase [Fundidesulfovibrio agrisoli]